MSAGYLPWQRTFEFGAETEMLIGPAQTGIPAAQIGYVQASMSGLDGGLWLVSGVKPDGTLYALSSSLGEDNIFGADSPPYFEAYVVSLSSLGSGAAPKLYLTLLGRLLRYSVT